MIFLFNDFCLKTYSLAFAASSSLRFASSIAACCSRSACPVEISPNQNSLAKSTSEYQKVSKNAMNTILQEWIPSFNIPLTGGCLPHPNWLVKSYPSTGPTFRACLFSLFNPSKLILPQAFLFDIDGISIGLERSNEIRAPSKHTAIKQNG